jgi:hypothetical protein
MNYNNFIKGIEYAPFTVERKDMGGYFSKKEVIEWLKENKIKYNLSQAYTPYVGHWGILIEKKYEKRFSDFVFDEKM